MVWKLGAILFSIFLVGFTFVPNALTKVNGFKKWETNTKNEEKIRPKRSGNRLNTDVVNHEFCLSCRTGSEKRRKEALEDVHTYAELKTDPVASLPSAFTICSTAVTTYGPYLLFFTLIGNDGNQLFGARVRQLSNSGLGKRFFYNNNWASVERMPVFPNQWVRSCIALNTASGLVQWVVDGILMENNTLADIKDSKNLPTDLTGKIILGAWQWASKWAAYRSEVTNLNIFSSALQIELMQQYTNGGQCVEEGDYLAWRDMQWSLHGQAVIETVDTEEACLEEPSVSLYYAGFRRMETCMHFCENLGSRAPSVINLGQWKSLQMLLRKKLSTGLSRRIWLPIDDKETEGVWRDFYTQEMLNSSLPWIESEPNGGLGENCVNMDSSYSFLWNDENCEHSGACICTRNHPPHLKLLGLCPGSDVDTFYRPINEFSNFTRLKLVGLYHSSIEYDLEGRKWKLTVAESLVTGSSKAALATFTLGRQNWTINGDMGCTSDGGEYTKELKMSGCKEGNFTCNDGQCVSMEQRCNQLQECRDKSDEKNCQILILEEGYNKNVPPVRVDKGNKEMVNVSVSIDILKLVDIDEEEYSIDIQFAITLTWIENRATYQNLKNDLTLNALTTREIEQLWLPKVIYENTDQKQTTRLGDGNWEWETRVVVMKKEKGIMSGLETVDETEIFKGSENDLVMMQTYTHKFQCPYDLKKYPFDTQTCSINMAMGPLDRTSVSLIEGQLHMNQSLDMPIFQITNWHLDQETNADEGKGLCVVLVLKRKISSELMTTFFPTLLLTAITFATTFFKPFFFEAALSVNLTTMLVMTTIFISKMEVLPTTSDIKMIDIWLVLCQMFPFAEVVLLTAMEYYRDDSHGEHDTMLMPLNVRQEDDADDSEEQRCQRCWIPDLKTLGDKLFIYCTKWGITIWF